MLTLSLDFHIEPGKPESFQLIPISATVLSLSWDSPSDPNGVITGYRISWKMIEDDRNMFVTEGSRVNIIKNGNAESFQIHDLGNNKSLATNKLHAITSIVLFWPNF